MNIDVMKKIIMFDDVNARDIERYRAFKHTQPSEEVFQNVDAMISSSLIVTSVCGSEVTIVTSDTFTRADLERWKCFKRKRQWNAEEGLLNSIAT